MTNQSQESNSTIKCYKVNPVNGIFTIKLHHETSFYSKKVKFSVTSWQCGKSLRLLPHPCVQYSLVMVMSSSFAYDVCAWAL